jgi:hypothetical protein
MTKSTSISPDYLNHLAIFAIFTLNLGLGLSYVVTWFSAGKQDLFWRADFTAFYTGGYIVADGNGSALYDQVLQTQIQQKILEDHSFQDGVLYYNNPPHVVFPFVLLAYLPLSSAYYVWIVFQVILLIWLLHILRRITKELSKWERWLIISACLAVPSMMLNFLLGAFSLFLLNCLLECYLALKNSRELCSGIWLSIGMIKPQAIVLPLIMFAGARRWRVFWGFFVFAVTAFTLSSITLGWHIWIDFSKMILSTGKNFDSFGVSPQDMYNLKGTLTLLLGNERADWINLISITALLVASMLTFVLWLKSWDPEKPVFELKFATTIIAGMFFSLHLKPQDGLIFVMPVLLFYMYLRKRNLPVTAFGSFALLCPLVFLLAEFTVAGSLGIRAPSLAMLIIGVWMTKALVMSNNQLTY